MAEMTQVLENQISQHYIKCNHEEPVRDPNKFYKLGDFGAVYSFIKTAEDSEWNRSIDRMKNA